MGAEQTTEERDRQSNIGSDIDRDSLRNALRDVVCSVLQDYRPFDPLGLTLPGLSFRSQEENDPLHGVLLDGIVSGLRWFLHNHAIASDMCRGLSHRAILCQLGMTEGWCAEAWKSACKRDPPRRRIWAHLRRTISAVVMSSRESFLCLFALLDRLAEAVALAVHLEDVAVMGQTIQESGGHTFPLEDLVPFAERQVAGDQQTGPFITIGEDLEQQFGSRTAEGQVA